MGHPRAVHNLKPSGGLSASHIEQRKQQAVSVPTPSSRAAAPGVPVIAIDKLPLARTNLAIVPAVSGVTPGGLAVLLDKKWYLVTGLQAV